MLFSAKTVAKKKKKNHIVHYTPHMKIILLRLTLCDRNNKPAQLPARTLFAGSAEQKLLMIMASRKEESSYSKLKASLQSRVTPTL